MARYNMEEIELQEGLMYRLTEQVNQAGTPEDLNIERLFKDLKNIGIVYAINCQTFGHYLPDQPCYGFQDTKFRHKSDYEIDLTIYNGEQGIILGLKPGTVDRIKVVNAPGYVSKVLDVYVPFVKEATNYGWLEGLAFHQQEK